MSRTPPHQGRLWDVGGRVSASGANCGMSGVGCRRPVLAVGCRVSDVECRASGVGCPVWALFPIGEPCRQHRANHLAHAHVRIVCVCVRGGKGWT
eukprot:354968-Chlamydomonas_euryale.AAC.1